MSKYQSRHNIFWQLHEAGCFVIPNPWDAGSARWLQHMGFKALASTSSGFAFAQAHADGEVPFEVVLDYLHDLVAATDVPINADFENGHAEDISTLKKNIRRCVATGVSGISIEDFSGNSSAPLYPLDEAVARMRAAREAIDESGENVMLIGRADGFFHGINDIDDAAQRIKAYAMAGADCLYAPAISTEDQVKKVVEAAQGKPVNVLYGPLAALGFDKLQTLGVRRISVGGSLALSAWDGFADAAEKLLKNDFSALTNHRVTHPELSKLFAK